MQTRDQRMPFHFCYSVYYRVFTLQLRLLAPRCWEPYWIQISEDISLCALVPTLGSKVVPYSLWPVVRLGVSS